jgi:hypothetical protein
MWRRLTGNKLTLIGAVHKRGASTSDGEMDSLTNKENKIHKL